MIRIIPDNSHLLLRYQADSPNNSSWVGTKLKQNGSVILSRTFTFYPEDLKFQSEPSEEEESITYIFVLGVLEHGYYKLKKEIFGLKHDLLLSCTMELKPKTFIAQRNISVFRRIDELIDEPIIVGGANENAIPEADFALLLNTFPTSTELTHYARDRIARILKDYFGTMSDAETKLNNYLKRKKKLPSKSKKNIVIQFELQKFEYVYDELQKMLDESESYTEKNWQKKILDLLLLIFPKYIAVLENIRIKDFYSTPNQTSNRFPDLTLIDADGNVDIIEIKRPFPNALLSHNTYRDNYIPRRELTGAIIQAEKYLFHLSKWGLAGEKTINEKYKNELPSDLKLKITNPKAMILLGRDNDFDGNQRFDFEIIRRQYVNMLDIITYDDLLRRVKNIIMMMQRKTTNSTDEINNRPAVLS
ncbi:Shedu immune nuclease family protein [Advenella alkanexedens]|uniref:Shedu immune nuclease family protein n=1 Tax=Advenella alkanexedens TaxID=1481665 RepID=UPI0026766D24|nr:Shedu immune nuclease family protein [Advenella alkanexedens]WKU19019.1 DUF4263 domain-containing protein [Advenella alkanexedens]